MLSKLCTMQRTKDDGKVWRSKWYAKTCWLANAVSIIAVPKPPPKRSPPAFKHVPHEELPGSRLARDDFEDPDDISMSSTTDTGAVFSESSEGSESCSDSDYSDWVEEPKSRKAAPKSSPKKQRRIVQRPEEEDGDEEHEVKVKEEAELMVEDDSDEENLVVEDYVFEDDDDSAETIRPARSKAAALDSDEDYVEATARAKEEKAPCSQEATKEKASYKIVPPRPQHLHHLGLVAARHSSVSNVLVE
ncbi:hypothetical protein MRX96_011453 [Rhipicephalus microplus]